MFLSLACCQWRIVRRWVILLRISCIRTYYERWVLDISWMLWYWNCVRMWTQNSEIFPRAIYVIPIDRGPSVGSICA
ncbi:hypothetical protein EPI10_027551 [Gossypium australe]|uniref:Uncharacterized protein n=1 Tax=Gossypium australe TaxID=47621 RepID=A0A5B6UXI3_9ROSI|nr:hypothetical protein EPI10_027551 [Gossypium australe]